ncbi:MAG TPA: TonB-dependent receptor, partial [Cupriavidus sp.]|nr:TonB-dependent receptor [Cupriavidus sp.]
MRLKCLAVVAGTLLSSTPHLRAQTVGTADPLPTVVVTGTRSEKTLDETPIRTEVVDRQEIERTHARTLKDALENVPGLQLREIHGKSGYEVTLQGMTSDQVLILIDGLPITASTGSTVDVSQYLLAEVDHVEVVKGASSAQYGSSAMGGVINVITRPISRGFSAAATADAGTYGSQNADGSPGSL